VPDVNAEVAFAEGAFGAGNAPPAVFVEPELENGQNFFGTARRAVIVNDEVLFIIVFRLAFAREF